MKLLHIDSSILGEQSVSRMLSKAAVDRLKELKPSMEIIYRDLVTSPLPHLTGSHLARVPDAIDDVTHGERALEEFIDADVIVIGVPLYNLSVSSQLKAWIDRIVVPGRTFRYTSHGPEGLAHDKRVILAMARGGHYRQGNGLVTYEHAESYLRSIFAFIGVPRLDVIAADGLAVDDAQKELSVREALRTISALKPNCAV
ncbi:FMN-dependent NADH-azoreductase [Agrobacterium tumefaciens]|uniref:FMN dependent NADH:quinone oxidoreductase n=1 Tax=Agrobacterium tumefaciens TaxID=358 RepID=A0A176XIB1_AGRTU|nr:NAD(P)H-dependent oxidoreductase [Agrobacterium tumefaciens]OAE48921.1 FMN-dependent NADH-azoreductase [Agrobacterium tumefaciens]